MKKYEFMVVDRKSGIKNENKGVAEQLNKFGQEGWEVVSTTSAFHGMQFIKIVLQREIK